MRDRLARLTIDDEGHRETELEQVLIAGYRALKWALPATAAGETIDAIAALLVAERAGDS